MFVFLGDGFVHICWKIRS